MAAHPLFLKPCAEKVFMPFLEEHFPHLVQSYKARYANRAFLPAEYSRRISALMSRLCQKYKIGERDERFVPKTTRHGMTQLALFAG